MVRACASRRTPLSLGEHLLDGTEVGRLGRQEHEPGAGSAHGPADGFALVAAEIVDDHDIAAAQAGMRELLGIGSWPARGSALRSEPQDRAFCTAGFAIPCTWVCWWVWTTPRMSLGHFLLAMALTGYVFIAMRYEERNLLHQFGSRYTRWRGAV